MAGGQKVIGFSVFLEVLNPLLAGSLNLFFQAENWLSSGEINCILYSLFCIFTIIIVIIVLVSSSIISSISIYFVVLLNCPYLSL